VSSSASLPRPLVRAADVCERLRLTFEERVCVVPRRPFHCDMWKADLSDNSAQHDACKQFKNNPNRNESRCASWDEVYGMYPGDGTSKQVELQVTRSVETQLGPAFGNYLMAQGSFMHYYTMNTAVPYLAFFTVSVFTGELKRTRGDL
jgi:hypothetical protein